MRIETTESCIYVMHGGNCNINIKVIKGSTVEDPNIVLPAVDHSHIGLTVRLSTV